MNKSFADQNASNAEYAINTFRPEDQILSDVRNRAEAAGLPGIHVGPMDGLHLEVLARSFGAKKIVEIGTLAGYSGICFARALPKDGKLYTFEYEPKHAEVASESFKRAGLSERVEIFVGPALEQLPKIEGQGPFDLVFIDADKLGYPAYLDWAVENLRVGGVILGDNTFGFGHVGNPEGASDRQKNMVKAIAEFNSKAATHPRLRSTILPTGEGLTMAVKIS